MYRSMKICKSVAGKYTSQVLLNVYAHALMGGACCHGNFHMLDLADMVGSGQAQLSVQSVGHLQVWRGARHTWQNW